jgi:hypothetical protein
MAGATGEIVETPTADLPFKAVISHDGEIIREQHFAGRTEAEIYIVDTLRGIFWCPVERAL